ncbi:MAG TPA: glutamine synthetase family protein [Candidatus Binatia bacterium]|nr:glutamine synthetase family protein [Candidatus Binatia bacterium]
MPTPGSRARPDRTRERQVRAIVRQCRAERTQLVRFLYCGNDSVIRGKACHVALLPSYLDSGIGLTVAMQSFNMLDQLAPEGSFGPVGEIRLVPDLGTFAVLPYAARSARLLCDMLTLDGEPWGACPRSFLRRMIAQAAADGFELQAAFENEFTLARALGDGHAPLDRSSCFSTIGMDAAGGVIAEIIDALVAQGVQPEQYYAELGPGQQELPVHHGPALRAADTQITLRETARGVASRHGLVASFAPKPFPDEAGNGSHIHFSLWRARDGRNHFHDPSGRHGLSEAAYGFIGGVLAHLPALVALTAPSVNSYRRLRPRFWSSAYTAWGPDNREAAVRVPSKRRTLEMESTNLELKPSDPSNNPYLALGGLLAAGLDGMARGLDPGEPALVDPDAIPDAERRRRGIHRLPATLGEALDNLERDEVLMGALGPVLGREYLIVKRSEVRGFEGRDTAFEIAHHFHKY